MPKKFKPRNIKQFCVQLTVVLLFTIVDHIIKYYAQRYLPGAGRIVLIPGILALRYTQNTGAAFGSLSGMTSILSVFTALILLGLMLFLLFEESGNKAYHIFLPLIIAGGLGNLIDRVFKGYVIDYLEFLFVKFAIFNFADCLVTVGCSAIMAYLIYMIIREQKHGTA